MRFKQCTVHSSQCTMKEELLESRMGRELTIDNGQLTIGKEVVILSGVKNLFSVILSLGKNLKGFGEVGERFE